MHNPVFLYLCTGNLIHIPLNGIFVCITLENNFIMGKIKYYTAESLQKIKDEINYLENVERPRISQAIADARDKGDLSENAEYHAAKEEQSKVEYKIVQLKRLLTNARLIDEDKIDKSKALLYSTVKMKNLDLGTEMEYTLVPETESDPMQKKISVSSPVAKGVLGKKVGEIAEVQTPSGLMRLEILEITRN